MSTPLPPPPPPPPRPPPPAYQQQQQQQEPYGAVQMTQRRTTATATTDTTTPAASPYYHGDQHTSAYSPYMAHATPAAASPMMPYQQATAAAPSPMTTSAPPAAPYAHNRAALAFLIPPLLAMLYSGRPEEESEHALLLPVFLCTFLVLYALDLANLRSLSFWGAWMAFFLLSGINAIDDFRKDTSLIYWMGQVATETLFFACWACWYMLQFQWLAKDSPVLMFQLKQILHGLLPLASACVLTNALAKQMTHHWGMDRAATLSPYIFALLLTAGMYFVGCATTTSSSSDKPDFVLSTAVARWHSILLMLVPPTMHVVSFWKRMVSSYASVDEWYDLILVVTIPYLLKFGLTRGKSPYGTFTGDTLRGTLVPIILSTIASLCLQQAYLIPWCQSIAYQFYGHDMPPTWIFSLYLMGATLATLFAVWVSGKKSSRTNEPLFGEFHEDVVQVSLAITGLCSGKAIGMPWSLTPLPILAFLGLSVWMTTRMLRYLAIFLFVLHSTGIVLFSYRFAGISSTINLSIPGINMGLIRFGMIVVLTSVLIGLVMGLAVRTPGGVGTSILKKVDVTGVLLVVYGLLLTTLECTLLKEPVPFQSLTGAEVTEWDVEDATLYDSWTALLTSVVLGGITFILQRYKLITSQAAVVSFSVAIGKAIAVYIDMNTVSTSEGTGDGSNKAGAAILLLRSLVAASLFVVMLAPRVFLKPVHVKTSAGGRYKRALGPSGKPVSDTPKNADRIIFVYAIVLVPLSLVVSVPIVLEPFAVALSGHYGGAYYVSPPGPAEILGFAMSLWGLSCLSMVNHYLPDGGGEMWKKLSALTFLMGVGVALSAPTVPDWAGGKRAIGSRNPYATISSVGAHLATADRSRSGGWGLISAALATLLAITGPLELQERRDATGRKDTLVLFRLMVFSIMFGCGVAWFITMQSMSEEEFLTVFVTATSCMAMAFFGTVAAVLGYFLELANFDEAEQVAKVWIGAFPVFGLIAGTSQLAGEASHPFGMGGWLSTYLALCGAVTLSFAIVVRSRSTKNASTRGLANLSCIASWVCSIIVLYGRYGVSGLDGGLDMTSVLGIPISVFGTFVISLILLVLEGEMSGSRRSKVQFMGGSSTKHSKSTFGINFQKLGNSNRFAPAVTGCIAVLLAASIYTIFLRGCGWLVGLVPSNHEQVFAKVYGDSRTTAGSDLASIVKKGIVHDQIMTTSAKLAGSGFWTSDGMFGPLLHVVGLVATLPSLYFLVSNMWSGGGSSKAALAAPLNLAPLILCKGIPALRALALIGLVGGLIQFLTRRQHDRQSKMQI